MKTSHLLWRSLFTSALLLSSCAHPPPPESPPAPPHEAPSSEPEPESAAPSASQEALRRAEATAQELAGTLKTNLVAAMSEQGPEAAARYCSVGAQGLTAGIADARGVSVGRSSLRLRNPTNAGPAWVEAWLAQQGERAADGVETVGRVDTLPDGSQVARVIKPLAIGGPCVVCHGPAESLAPGVRAVLLDRYPGDAATGYSIGDLRGALWAEAAVGGSAPTTLQMFGALRAVMHQGDYGSKVSLGELLAEPGGHGVGALEGLAGEVTFDGGTAWLSTPDGSGAIATTKLEPGAGSDRGVALLAFHRVDAWTTRTLEEPASLAELGDRIRDAATEAGLSLDHPIPFRVEGPFEQLKYHVIDGSKLPAGPSSHDAHKDAGITVEHAAVEATLIGLWSTEHAGIFTHMGDTTHVHVTVAEPLGSGHVDEVRVPTGARLMLPTASRGP